MAWFNRRSNKRQPYKAVTDEERISRYVYLLNTLPASVIEKAHASAFKEFSIERRKAMFDELRPFMSAEEQKHSPQPALLAKVLGRATEQRRAGAAVAVAERGPERGTQEQRLAEVARLDPFVFANMSLTTSVATYFLATHAVQTYFTAGAGSIAIEGEPAWVGELGGVSVGGMDGTYGGGYGSGFDGGFGDFGGFDGGGGGGDGGGGGF